MAVPAELWQSRLSCPKIREVCTRRRMRWTCCWISRFMRWFKWLILLKVYGTPQQHLDGFLGFPIAYSGLRQLAAPCRTTRFRLNFRRRPRIFFKIECDLAEMSADIWSSADDYAQSSVWLARTQALKNCSAACKETSACFLLMTCQWRPGK